MPRDCRRPRDEGRTTGTTTAAIELAVLFRECGIPLSASARKAVRRDVARWGVPSTDRPVERTADAR